MFLLHWPSPTPFQHVPLTAVLAEPIPERLVSHSHPPNLGIPDPRCNWFALYQTQHLPRNRLCCHLDYPSHHSSLANLQCQICFQVSYHRHIRLDDGWSSGFGGYLRFEFIFLRGLLQTKLVAKDIFLTIWMHPHHHVEWVTRLLRQSLPCPKCILRQLSACFQCKIPSGQHVGFGFPSTSPNSSKCWPFCVMPFNLPFSSFPSYFLCSWHPILCQLLPKSRYWLEQTDLQQLFRDRSRRWFLTPSSQ